MSRHWNLRGRCLDFGNPERWLYLVGGQWGELYLVRSQWDKKELKLAWRPPERQEVTQGHGQSRSSPLHLVGHLLSGDRTSASSWLLTPPLPVVQNVQRCPRCHWPNPRQIRGESSCARGSQSYRLSEGRHTDWCHRSWTCETWGCVSSPCSKAFIN